MFRPTQVPLLYPQDFAYGALTRSGSAFQRILLSFLYPLSGPITPAHAFRHRRFGLFPVRSPLLGESLLLSLPAGTKMFQFPAFAPLIRGVTESLPPGCPIRTSAGQGVFATLRSFSQLVTSFSASESQGIPHAPLVVPLYLLAVSSSEGTVRYIKTKFDKFFRL